MPRMWWYSEGDPGAWSRDLASRRAAAWHKASSVDAKKAAKKAKKADKRKIDKAQAAERRYKRRQRQIKRQKRGRSAWPSR